MSIKVEVLATKRRPDEYKIVVNDLISDTSVFAPDYRTAMKTAFRVIAANDTWFTGLCDNRE